MSTRMASWRSTGVGPEARAARDHREEVSLDEGAPWIGCQFLAHRKQPTSVPTDDLVQRLDDTHGTHTGVAQDRMRGVAETEPSHHDVEVHAGDEGERDVGECHLGHGEGARHEELVAELRLVDVGLQGRFESTSKADLAEASRSPVEFFEAGTHWLATVPPDPWRAQAPRRTRSGRAAAVEDTSALRPGSFDRRPRLASPGGEATESPCLEGSVHGRDAGRARGDPRRRRLVVRDRRSRAAAVEPQEGLLARRGLHEGRPARLLLQRRLAARAPPRRAPAHDEADARRHRRPVLLREVGALAHARLARAVRGAERGRQGRRDRLPHDRRHGRAALRREPRLHRVPPAALALRRRRSTPTTCSSTSTRSSPTRTRTCSSWHGTSRCCSTSWGCPRSRRRAARPACRSTCRSCAARTPTTTCGRSWAPPAA